MAAVLGYPGFWVRELDTGIDWVQAGARRAGRRRCIGRCAPRGTVIGRTRIVDVVDKGAGKGALVYTERKVTDKATRRAHRHRHADHVLPRRRRLRRAAARDAAAAPDSGTRARSRLRPRHAAGGGADLPSERRPQSAACRSRRSPRRRASRARSCTGSRPSASSATRCSRACAAMIPTRLASIAGRFSAPVFPGETIRTEMWRDGAVVSFRALRAGARRGRHEQRPRRGQVMDARAGEGSDIAQIREVGARAVRGFSRRVLARARPRARLSDRVRGSADRGRLPRRADPGGIRRQRAGHDGRRRDPGGDPRARAATAPPAMRRCTRWARCCGTAAPSRRRATCPASPTGELRLQAFGVTEPTSGTDTTQPAHHARCARATTLCRQRPEDLDLARRAFRPDAAARAHHAARAGARSAPTGCRSSSSTCASVGKGLTIRPIRTMMNHATTEMFFDNLRVPADNLIGEEGKGFRYILDGMNAERILIAAEVHRRRQVVHREGHRLRQGARRVRPADRPEPGRAVPDRARLCRRCAPPS